MILQPIAQIIYDKKGFNILALDVRDVCNMTDYFLIAEGNVAPHVQALATEIVDYLVLAGHPPIHIEGFTPGEWVAIDALDVMIHLMIPELRERYAIEEVWNAGKIVDLHLIL